MKHILKTLHVLLIPGAGLQWSLKRVELAKNQLLDEDADLIIFTGGGVVPNPIEGQPDVTEAQLMQMHYLHLNGRTDIPTLREDESKHTFENISFSIMKLRKWMHDQQLMSDYQEVVVTIATTLDHLKRFQVSWNAIAAMTWGISNIELKAEYVPVYGIRSITNHLIERFFLLPLHLLSKTGEKWPVSLIFGARKKQLSRIQLSD